MFPVHGFAQEEGNGYSEGNSVIRECVLMRLVDRTRRFVRKVDLAIYDRTSPYFFPSSLKDYTQEDVEVHGTGGGTYAVLPSTISSSSIIYSAGVGADVSFEMSLHAKHGMQVFAFDPTPEAARYVEQQSLPKAFHYFQVALGGTDDRQNFSALKQPASHYFPGSLEAGMLFGASLEVDVKKLSTIMKELGHDRIDLLKLDIEGSEYSVLETVLEEKLPVKQLVLEFHPHILNQKHHFTLSGRHGWTKTDLMIHRLRAAGYRPFHVSKRMTEVSFIRDESSRSPSRQAQ